MWMGSHDAFRSQFRSPRLIIAASVDSQYERALTTMVTSLAIASRLGLWADSGEKISS